MIKKQVWRYYCEFCKKSGCSAYHIRNHENGCTNNPNRVCGYCNAAGYEQASMTDLIAALGDGTDLDAIRELANDCPACILAAIRQSGVQFYTEDEEGRNIFHVDFDFPEEKKAFWDHVNEQRSYNQYDY